MTLQKTFILALVLSFLPTVAFAQTELEDLQIVTDPIAASSQPPAEEFYRGLIVEIIEESQEDVGLTGSRSYFQKVLVIFEDGPRIGEEVTIEYGSLSESQKLVVGQRVVVISPENVGAFIFDKYRLPALGGMFLLFIALAVATAGWRGLTSLAGLVVSVAVLILYAVPQIMDGKNPLIISLISAAVIALIAIYLAHGFNRRTTVAVVSTLVTVIFTIGLAQLFVKMSGVTGVGSEEAFYLQTSSASFINLKGLLLGGIIIGALGVLDDITTAQAAAVDEIWKANPKMTRRELYERASSVGREHITSLVNTLALAYVGASFPALLLFTVYQRPWWVVANTEVISEEIVRTLVGSMALMLAVPITTLLAVWWLPKQSKSVVEE